MRGVNKVGVWGPVTLGLCAETSAHYILPLYNANLLRMPLALLFTHLSFPMMCLHFLIFFFEFLVYFPTSTKTLFLFLANTFILLLIIHIYGIQL